MAIDKLQNEIRRLKNPSMVAFFFNEAHIPLKFLEEETSVPKAYLEYAKAVLTALKDIVPAVRFGFSSFALMGSEGTVVLTQLLRFAKQQGYYVLLDVPESYSSQVAEHSAKTLMENWKFDGLLLGCYLGSDGIDPFVDRLKDTDHDLFLALRTANRSAPQMQDLLTGTRLVYTVAADMAKRLGQEHITRCGYSRIAGVGPATSAESLRTLRSKYPAMFLLIDGYDYSGANAKNCSAAFDGLGHGAIACGGESILGAWKQDDGEPVTLAVQAAERMKKNLTRYVTVL